MKSLDKLAIGESAVGTGLNTPRKFGQKLTLEISRLNGHPFITAPNKDAAQASPGAIINFRPEIKYNYNAFISD
jgi:fumarate hydratase class II